MELGLNPRDKAGLWRSYAFQVRKTKKIYLCTGKQGEEMGQKVHKAQQEKETIKYVYIAGPYTQGNTEENVTSAVMIGDQLLKAGFTPFIPHLTHLWANRTSERWDYEDWLEYDFKWLRKCDALLRMAGPSRGADREVSLARQLNIPVFLSFEELLKEMGRDIPDELRW